MESIWSKTCGMKQRSPLSGDLHTEAVIIGGGMAGILTAYQLERSGIRTVVLEAERIGSGQTKNTTAKITAQHGLICRTLAEKKGKEVAAQFVMANQIAVEEFEKVIQDEHISCDFEPCSSYVYSDNEQALREEAKMAASFGLPAVFTDQIEIPVPCAGAVRFDRQAKFHPLKFLDALAQQLTIYEQTPVLDAEEHSVKTASGQVTADYIIFATHFPFINFPGMYFARMHQKRSYVLALADAGILNGMYIGDQSDSLSFRQYGRYLLLGGQGHRTGENKDGGNYERLRQKARHLYPGSREVAWWSAQDCMTADQIPFIGHYAAERPDWFVATGFQKWGMTSSMLSAMLLRDLICGIKNPYADVFAPSRFSADELSQIVRDSGKAVSGLTKRFFQIPEETISMLQPGHGAIVETDSGKAGVYKTDDQKIYQVDIVCPHLGCQLAWNPDERTWDCPCHGSRFDYKGNLLTGPAQRGIHND